MARTQYFVVHHQGQWKVSLNGQHYGPYVSQKAAIKAAVEAAHSTGRKGGDAQVLVQSTNNNQFRTEWTYGHDPYPPAG
jgi:hypothetical protein